ncbi:MAG: hypothetical protein ABIQ18_13510 [Umezawaea sp.]
MVRPIHYEGRAHPRRQFLRAVGATGAGVVAVTCGLGRALSEVDVFETSLDAYSSKVVKYTTPWGPVADDWYPAFLAAQDDLAAYSGGRLVVPGGNATTERKSHISRCVVFDLVPLEKSSPHVTLMRPPRMRVRSTLWASRSCATVGRCPVPLEKSSLHVMRNLSR